MKIKPYIQVDWEDPEYDKLILKGDREGFEFLKDQIDKLLATATDEDDPLLFEEDHIDLSIDSALTGLTLQSTKPIEEVYTESFKDKVFGMGCCILVLSLVASSIYGLASILQKAISFFNQ